MNRGACHGAPDAWFYPDLGPGMIEGINAAKRVCARCPVRVECLDYALANNEKDGIWGGTSGRERRRLKAERRVA
jgi:WhiB family redox-sensing transcriptional regulator